MKYVYSISGVLILGIISHYVSAATSQRAASPHVISIFLEPLYNAPKRLHLHEKLKKPGIINRTIIKHYVTSTSSKGIFATYAGFVSYSDNNGQIFFPRKHEKDEITYVLTQKIKPIILQSNTVNFFVVAPNANVAYVKAERLFDQQRKIHYWHVANQSIPETRRIPIFSINIFVKPQHIVIPEGDFVADDSPHLILPPIFTTSDISREAHALLFLKVSKFFSPVKLSYKYTTERYAVLIKS